MIGCFALASASISAFTRSGSPNGRARSSDRPSPIDPLHIQGIGQTLLDASGRFEAHSQETNTGLDAPEAELKAAFARAARVPWCKGFAIGRTIFGKPEDRADALRMLGLLSGRTHEVLTAVALASSAGLSMRVSVSAVRFRSLTMDEIAAYWETGEPRDKAGAYAVQGLGAVFIESLSGSAGWLAVHRW